MLLLFLLMTCLVYCQVGTFAPFTLLHPHLYCFRTLNLLMNRFELAIIFTFIQKTAVLGG